MKIPFHRPYIAEEEMRKVVLTLKSGILTTGPKTAQFEKNFSGYLGCKYSIAVNSGTAALHIALAALGIKKDDEVIVPAMTFTATAQAICYTGAKPILVDVDKLTHNIDIAGIKKAITPRTKAIVPVHYAGQPCDMDEIMAIAKKYGLYVVEDAAHALPAVYKNRKIGAIGDITCFSFYATKPLCTGEGGMAVTENRKWADKMRILRIHGISHGFFNRYAKPNTWHYSVEDLGFKYNMPDMAAALGLAQLKRQYFMYKKRLYIANKYSKCLAGQNQMILPEIRPGIKTAWHLYVIKIKPEMLKINRDEFIRQLSALGVSASVHFIPLYRHLFYKKAYGYSPKDFPNCEWLYKRIISLPIYPGMQDKEIDYVTDSVRKICDKYKR